MRIHDCYLMTRPGIANAQGFSGSSFQDNGRGHSCLDLDVDSGAIAHPDAAFKIPFRWRRRRYADKAVVVLYQGFCEREGYDTFLLYVELTGGTAPGGEAVYVLLVSPGQGNQCRPDLVAEAEPSRLHGIETPILVNWVRARCIRGFG